MHNTSYRFISPGYLLLFSLIFSLFVGGKKNRHHESVKFSDMMLLPPMETDHPDMI